MLLPSALPCSPRPGLRHFAPFTQSHQPFSPPATPRSHHNVTTEYSSPLRSTCRALQNLLGVQPPVYASMLNGSKRSSYLPQPARTRVTKRSTPPPSRGLRKRRRDSSSADEEERMQENSNTSSSKKHAIADPTARAFSTPKRRRRAPEIIPFGLERSDFDSPRATDLDMHMSISRNSSYESSMRTDESSTSSTTTTPPTTTMLSLPALPSSLAKLSLDPTTTNNTTTSTLPFSAPHQVQVPSSFDFFQQLQKPDPQLSLYQSPLTHIQSRQDDADRTFRPPRPQPQPQATATTTATTTSSSPSPPLSWTAKDDAALVDVVLSKLRLSREDWQDCASRLRADAGITTTGADLRDGADMERMWRGLIGDRRVGLVFGRGSGSGSGQMGHRSLRPAVRDVRWE